MVVFMEGRGVCWWVSGQGRRARDDRRHTRVKSSRNNTHGGGGRGGAAGEVEVERWCGRRGAGEVKGRCDDGDGGCGRGGEMGLVYGVR